MKRPRKPKQKPKKKPKTRNLKDLQRVGFYKYFRDFNFNNLNFET